MSDNTRELILNAKAGDGIAIGRLYELHKDKGLSIARQYVRTPEDAEDMYQDAFLKAMEHLDTFDISKEFAPWLDVIIVNTCKNYLVKKKAVNFSDMSDEETEFADTIDNKDESLVPELSYDRKEFMNIIGNIVNELPPAQQQAVKLFYYRELSVKQIAELQNVPEDTVKSRLNYSRKKIGTAVEEYEKKTGIKLHGILVIPILALFFKRTAYAAEAGSTAYTVVKGAVNGASIINDGISASKAVSSAASSGIQESGKKIAKKVVAGTARRNAVKLAAKVIGSLLGVTVAVGGIHAVTTKPISNSIEREGIITSPREVNENALKRMQKEAESSIRGYVDKFKNDPGHRANATDPKYEGLAVMEPKEDSEKENRIILVYSVYWTPSDGKAFENVKLYYPYSFGDVATYKNGTVDYDLNKSKAEYSYKDAVYYSGTNIWGYKDPVNMYTELVRSKSEDYTCTPDAKLKKLVN